MHDEQPDLEIDDETMEEVIHQMSRRRFELAESHEGGYGDFQCSLIVRGNKMKETGDAVQGVLASFRNQIAEQFCVLNSKQRTVSLLYSVYTEAHANILARAWAHRMQHGLDLAMERGSLYQEFSAVDRASYQEPTEFEILAAGQAYAATRKRIAQIRCLI